MTCPNCGEALVGDGYSLVPHCPRVDVDGSGLEPDANPVYCSAEKDTGEQLLDLLASWLTPGVLPSPEELNKAYQLAGQLSAALDDLRDAIRERGSLTMTEDAAPVYRWEENPPPSPTQMTIRGEGSLYLLGENGGYEHLGEAINFTITGKATLTITMQPMGGGPDE